jgi:hypothetical protein
MTRRSFRLRKHTLSAIKPMAITKAATAATESPAICAGVILGGASAAVAAATGVDVVEEVAGRTEETVSAKAVCVELLPLCTEDVMVGVFVAVGRLGDGDMVWVALVTTYVRTLLVGMTASFCPRQIPYVELSDAWVSSIGHDR